jgi:hypothetical protein
MSWRIIAANVRARSLAAMRSPAIDSSASRADMNTPWTEKTARSIDATVRGDMTEFADTQTSSSLPTAAGMISVIGVVTHIEATAMAMILFSGVARCSTRATVAFAISLFIAFCVP